MTLGVTAALVVGVAPGQAWAKRLASDEIGGVAFESSGLKPRSAPDIDAAAGTIVTADGRVLWSRRRSDRRPMASITKTMLALVVLERAALDEQVVVSKRAAGVDYALGLRPGERRTVGELLELALVASSNDAAYALAEHVGGTADSFVKLMNDKANDLELEDTHFSNPHGLDESGHYSSASDIVALTATAMKDPEFRRIVAMKRVVLPAYEKRSARSVKATNELLSSYPGMDGGKTGFTDDAGYSFVGVAERDGIALTGVILGASSNSARFRNTRRLLDWGFKHYRRQRVGTTTETVGAVRISVDPSKTVAVSFAEETSLPVFDLDGPVERDVSLPPEINLPVFAGQQIGTVELTQHERVLAEVPVVALADVASVGETVGAVPVADYLDRTVVARTAESSLAVPAFEPGSPVQREVRLDSSVAAPVRVSQQIGEIVYSQHGKQIVAVPVVAAQSVDAPGVLGRIGTWFARGWRKLLGEPLMASPELVS